MHHQSDFSEVSCDNPEAAFAASEPIKSRLDSGRRIETQPVTVTAR